MKWININSKFPSIGERVLGYSTITGIQIVYMNIYGIWKYSHDSEVMDGDITYWMLLPKIPQELKKKGE